jgi:putative transposase
MADKKVDSARALVAGGWRISLVSRCLRVSRAQLHAMARRSKDWQDRRCKRKPDDTEALARIHTGCDREEVVGTRSSASSVMGSSSGTLFSVVEGGRSFPSRQYWRHLNSRLSLIPCSRASCATEISGRCESSTILILNSTG